MFLNSYQPNCLPWQVGHGVLDLFSDEVELVPPVVGKASVKRKICYWSWAERSQIFQLVKPWNMYLVKHLLFRLMEPVSKLPTPSVAIETRPPTISTASPTLKKEEFSRSKISFQDLTSFATVKTFCSLADHLTDHMLMADIRPGAKRGFFCRYWPRKKEQGKQIQRKNLWLQ